MYCYLPGHSVDIWSLKKMNICMWERSNKTTLKECKKDWHDRNWIKEFSIVMEVKERDLTVPFALTKTATL